MLSTTTASPSPCSKGDGSSADNFHLASPSTSSNHSQEEGEKTLWEGAMNDRERAEVANMRGKLNSIRVEVK